MTVVEGNGFNFGLDDAKKGDFYALQVISKKGKETKFELKKIKRKELSKDDLLEVAWGLIANANEGDWDEATKDWKGAAERWRDDYHNLK